MAGEVRDPGKNLPLAFLGGVPLVAAVYLLVSFAFLAVVPLENIASNTAFVAQFGRALFVRYGQPDALRLRAALGPRRTDGPDHGRTARLLRDGPGRRVLPAFGRLHPRFGTPVHAILLQTGLALVVLTLGAFDRILAYIVFSAVVFLGLSATALFRLRPPVARWWFPAAPILFVAGCVVIGLLILMHDPWPALLGAAVVLGGDVLRRFFPTAR